MNISEVFFTKDESGYPILKCRSAIPAFAEEVKEESKMPAATPSAHRVEMLTELLSPGQLEQWRIMLMQIDGAAGNQDLEIRAAQILLQGGHENPLFSLKAYAAMIEA